ncbi:DUF4302 domain-containing protein [Dyadobacter tibetensis]|uniref:DUF4302 domain-containing protein n=1 Tax=Dyadobacter tibetensis TaxID=1211851 RepID=UPI000470A255|nr:DUF4302 domain-containing protein [Dyadobacter tibetensis]
MKISYLHYLIFLLAFGLWSCAEEESVFEQTADERVNAALADYQKQLSGAANGWKGIIYPGAGGVYSFYFKFNDQNRVQMYSDFNMETASVMKESSFRLKAMQSPSLIFDTYSYLHLLADPSGSVNGGNNGEGLISDYEFSFQPNPDNPDQMLLIGTKNKTRLVLVKASQEEAVAYEKGELAKSFIFSNIGKYLTYFKRMTVGGIEYEIAVNQTARTVTLSWLDGTNVKSFTTEYYYSSTGVSFLSAFVQGSTTIDGFSGITWDPATLSLGLTAGGSKTVIRDATKPLKVDVDAAKRWYNTALSEDTYWVSEEGFHINGVDDALKVKSLTSGAATYYFYLYWPGYGSNYDGFAPVFSGETGLSLAYLDAVKTPTFTSDGRVVFSGLGVAGTYPTNGPAVDSRNYLYDTSGFYLIELSADRYDMVSAKDAKGWISWVR